jgi:hypothetical protein
LCKVIHCISLPLSLKEAARRGGTMPTTTMKKSRRFQPSWRYARCPNMKPMASTLMRHSERKITWGRVKWLRVCVHSRRTVAEK